MGVEVIAPNQVWSTDITYIRLHVALCTWWRLSNTMDAGFCVDCLEEAIKNYGSPKIFNTDQGSQFTSDRFTGVLIQQGISMGRYLLLQYLHSPHPCGLRAGACAGQPIC